MKKHIIKLALLTLAITLISVPAITRAQDMSTNSMTTTTNTAPVIKKKKGGQAIHGKVAAIDTTAQTITVGKTVVTVTDTTKIKKNGQTATFSDIMVGDAARITYKKDSEGKATAVSIMIGVKPAPTATPAPTTTPAAN